MEGTYTLSNLLPTTTILVPLPLTIILPLLYTINQSASTTSLTIALIICSQTKAVMSSPSANLTISLLTHRSQATIVMRNPLLDPTIVLSFQSLAIAVTDKEHIPTRRPLMKAIPLVVLGVIVNAPVAIVMQIVFRVVFT